MKLYEKIIDGVMHCKPASRIVLIKDGMQIFNPTEEMLLEEGILTQAEAPYAEKMLSAAAQTYVASLVTSLVYFLRFFLWVMILFGGNSRRR